MANPTGIGGFRAGEIGNPSGRPPGAANRRSEELRRRLRDRGDVDPAEYCSSIVSSPNESTELKLQAANYLLPYLYSKRGAVTPPRYVEEIIHVPEFTHLSDAEQFLARITALVSQGQLDLQTGLELSTLAKNWLDAQYCREELAIKQLTTGTTEHEQIIRVEGGLPPLPGTNVTMPVLDGNSRVTNGHALEPPAPAVPAIESSPNDSIPTNGQGPDTHDSAPETMDGQGR